MGAKRSPLAAYNEELQELARSKGEKRDRAKSVPGAWRDAAKRFSWIERAGAWDKFEAQKLESGAIEARSSFLEKRMRHEDAWLDREVALKERAYQWLEDYIYGRVTQTKITKKERSGDEGGFSEESTTEMLREPPQWMLQYLLGDRNHAKHLNTLYDLLQQILAMEGTSEDLQAVKALVQATLESMLLAGGADEIRLFIRSAVKPHPQRTQYQRSEARSEQVGDIRRGNDELLP